MVNYLYELDRIEENHEAYAHRDRIATSDAFEKQLAAAPAEPAPAPAARGARLKLPAIGRKSLETKAVEVAE